MPIAPRSSKKEKNPNGHVCIHLLRGFRRWRWSVTTDGECVGHGMDRTKLLARAAASAVARRFGWSGRIRSAED